MVEGKEQESPKVAFAGERSCELQVIAIQDKVFLQGPVTARHIER